MKTPSLTRENSHGLKSVKEYHFTEKKRKRKLPVKTAMIKRCIA